MSTGCSPPALLLSRERLSTADFETFRFKALSSGILPHFVASLCIIDRKSRNGGVSSALPSR